MQGCRPTPCQASSHHISGRRACSGRHRRRWAVPRRRCQAECVSNTLQRKRMTQHGPRLQLPHLNADIVHARPVAAVLWYGTSRHSSRQAHQHSTATRSARAQSAGVVRCTIAAMLASPGRSRWRRSARPRTAAPARSCGSQRPPGPQPPSAQCPFRARSWCTRRLHKAAPTTGEMCTGNRDEL